MELAFNPAPLELRFAGGVTIDFPAAPRIELAAPGAQLVLPDAPQLEFAGAAAIELKGPRLAIELAQAGSQGPPGGQYETQNFVADAAMIAARQVALPHQPIDPADVELSIYGGIEQRAGVDFVVTGHVVSWAGLALELLLDVGSAFTVRYLRS